MPPKGHSSSSHSSRSSSHSSRSSSRSSSSRSSSSRSSGSRSSYSGGSGSRYSGSSRGPSRHSSTSRSSYPVRTGPSARTMAPSRPRTNQPTGYRGSGEARPAYYYGHRHDYIFFPVSWTDEETGTSYEKGFYDENGQRYDNISFERNGRYENVVCHCPYCDQNTILNPSADEIAARTLQCPHCGGALEIRSALDIRQAPAAAAAAYAPVRRRSGKWIVLLVVVLIFAGLCALGSYELKKEAQQLQSPTDAQNTVHTASFQITETYDEANPDLFGTTLYLAGSPDRGYTVSKDPADKMLIWDSDADSYYDKDSDCWIWYNTDVEPAVWQYWYEDISSDFGDYGWMEHDEDGWFIEESYDSWIELPDTYDTGRLWYITD